MYLQNKYTLVYYTLVERAKSRELDEYTEKHHIIPESFYKQRSRKGPAGWLDGNPEAPENIVRLTAREHFICHLLLPRMTEGLAKRKMTYALWNIINGRDNSKKKERYKVTSRQYVSIRQSVSRAISETHKGKILSDGTKKLISESRGGQKSSFKGKTHTEENKKFFSEQRSKKCIGPNETIYDSMKAATLSTGISRKMLLKKIVKRIDGWRYLDPIDQEEAMGKYESRKKAPGEPIKGRKWWNDGMSQIRSVECPGENFIPGRLNASHDKNGRYDHTIYDFIHDSGIVEKCQRYQLQTKYGLSGEALCMIVKGKRPVHKGWRLFISS
jgi:hypothetical protein